MPAVGVVDKYLLTVFDGSNQAEIATALANDYTFVSLTGGTLTFTVNFNNYSLATGDSVRHANGNFFGAFTPSQVTFNFNVLAAAADITALDARVDDLEAVSGILSAGITETPTLLLGQSATVAVNLVPAMPDTSYTPSAQLIGPSTALGSLSITAVSIVDVDTVNVTVQNSGLVNLSGIHLLVVAKDA